MKTKTRTLFRTSFAAIAAGITLSGCRSQLADMHLDEYRIDLHLKDGTPIKGLVPYVCSPERHHACNYRNPVVAGEGLPLFYLEY